jgi:tetratricopeptide (TPR) repeat protein
MHGTNGASRLWSMGLFLRCINCGRVNREGDQTCRDCGRALTTPPEARRTRSGRVVAPASSRLPSPVVAPKQPEEGKKPKLTPTGMFRAESESGLIFSDSAEDVLPVGRSVGPWLHCPPFDSRPVGDEVRLGRSPEADFVLAHIEVARAHATLKKMPSGEIVLSDNQSPNGTFLNGERISTKCTVKIGDRIKIGPFELTLSETRKPPKDTGSKETVELGSSAPPAAKPPSAAPPSPAPSPAPPKPAKAPAAEADEPGREFESTMLMGRIGAVRLSDILQHIATDKKSGTLRIYDDLGTNGWVVIEAGRPLVAAWGSIQDDDAVRAMLRVTAGSFALSADRKATAPTIRTELATLISELANEQKERASARLRRVGNDAKELFDRIDGYTSRPAPKSPLDARALINRGLVRAKQGDLDRAIEEFSRAIELEPQLAAAWFDRGLSRERKGDVERAMADYSRAIAIEPANLAFRLRRGIVRGMSANFEGAMEDCSMVIERDSRAAPAYVTRSCARRGTGDFKGAIEDASRAIALDRMLAMAWLHRGLARQRMGEKKGALEDLENYLTLAPQGGFAASTRVVVEHLKSELST